MQIFETFCRDYPSLNGHLPIKLGLADGLTKCNKSDKRCGLIRLSIKTDRGFHANTLLYDIKRREIERFEPHGQASMVTGIEINRALKKMFAKYGVKYLYQFDFCPYYGPHHMERFEAKAEGDPEGFCQAWSTYWLSVRMANPDVGRDELMTHVMSHISQYKTFIRNFSCFLLRQKAEILEQFKRVYGYELPSRGEQTKRQ